MASAILADVDVIVLIIPRRGIVTEKTPQVTICMSLIVSKPIFVVIKFR